MTTKRQRYRCATCGAVISGWAAFERHAVEHGGATAWLESGSGGQA